MRCRCLLCSIVTNHSPVVGGQKDVVVGRAVAVAGASLDEHHLLLHQFSVRTFKLHVEGGGGVRGAAPAVRAHSAELGPVGPRAGAAGKFKLHRLGQPRSTDTLLAFLRREGGQDSVSDLLGNSTSPTEEPFNRGKS